MSNEPSYICDSCGEEIVIPVDLSAGKAYLTDGCTARQGTCYASLSDSANHC